MIDPAVLSRSAAAGDLVYPYAEYLPIKEAATQAKITPRLLIFHSMAGPQMTSLDALWRYVNRDDVHTEPTFILDMAGRMAQLVPADVRADCNAQANGFAGSVETQDEGSPTLPSTSWTQPQVEQLAGLAAWYYLRFAVPLDFPSAWDGAGVGFHSLYPQWSIYVGKTCPGAARIAQMRDVLARARVLAAPSLVSEVPDMARLVYPPGGGIGVVNAFGRRYVKSESEMHWMRLAGEVQNADPVPIDATVWNGLPARD